MVQPRHGLFKSSEPKRSLIQSLFVSGLGLTKSGEGLRDTNNDCGIRDSISRVLSLRPLRNEQMDDGNRRERKRRGGPTRLDR